MYNLANYGDQHLFLKILETHQRIYLKHDTRKMTPLIMGTVKALSVCISIKSCLLA